MRFRHDAVPRHPDATPSRPEEWARSIARTVGRSVTRRVLSAAARRVPDPEPVAVSRVPVPPRLSAPRAARRLPLAPAVRTRALTERASIALLNPRRFAGIPVTRFHRSEYLFAQGNPVPAMDLAYFAAVAAGHAHVTLIEANAEDLSFDEVLARLDAARPELIVAKGVVNILAHDLAAPLEYKRRHPEARVVLSCRGAIGAEAAVFARFPELDGIARGEVDAFAADLCARPDLEDVAGLARPGQPAGAIRVVEDLDAHPFPDLDALPDAWYGGRQRGRRTGFDSSYYGVPSGYYLTSARGCPYRCAFCMVGGVEGRPFRFRRRDPDNVIEELRRLRRRGIHDVYLFDEIFTMPGHGDRIAERIVESQIPVRFVCEGKPDLVTAPMLERLARAGCIAVYYGIESGDDAILAAVEKGHDSADSRRAIQLTKAAGIPAGAYAMLGFPDETLASALRTAALLIELEPDLIRYDFLMPYPVTVIHAAMRAAGLVGEGFEQLDRHISPYHEGGMAQRTAGLSRPALRALDLAFKLSFCRELARSPVP